MSRLADSDKDFVGAVTRAADDLGLAPLFVEKDYWVTQVLRALHDRYPGAFVLKGGTSLSKGYGLIERFSEDVDVLVQPASGDSAKSREGLLENMSRSVAEALGIERSEGRPPGRGRFPHRADILVYPRVAGFRGPVPVENRGVLLETGYAGGEWPAEMVTLRPIICSPLGIEEGEYEDTDSFSVRALLPARTLLEKLSLLHHVATRFDRDAVATDERFGRHYYDVYRLLDHGPTRAALEDRKQFELLLADMQVISANHYGGWTERPDSGYADSLAFVPPPESELRGWLERHYADAADLMPAKVSARWPKLGQVLKRIEQHRELL